MIDYIHPWAARCDVCRYSFVLLKIAGTEHQQMPEHVTPSNPLANCLGSGAWFDVSEPNGPRALALTDAEVCGFEYATGARCARRKGDCMGHLQPARNVNVALPCGHAAKTEGCYPCEAWHSPSVIINNSPLPPLSAGSIAKLEELNRRFKGKRQDEAPCPCHCHGGDHLEHLPTDYGGAHGACIKAESMAASVLFDKPEPAPRDPPEFCAACNRRAPEEVGRLSNRNVRGLRPKRDGWMVAVFPFVENHSVTQELKLICPPCAEKVAKFIAHLSTPMLDDEDLL